MSDLAPDVDTNDYEDCEQCDSATPPDRLDAVSVNDTDYNLCDGCRESIESTIENYYWYDRYTEDHHEKAVSILEEQDEILCVHGGHYKAGEIIVHTNYVSSEVISDICDHFGFQIGAFGPRWDTDDAWKCTEEHGSCFEIVLDYKQGSPPPLPLVARFNRVDIEWLDDDDKQF